MNQFALASAAFKDLLGLVNARVIPPTAILLHASKLHSILHVPRRVWVGQDGMPELLHFQEDNWARMLLGADQWQRNG